MSRLISSFRVSNAISTTSIFRYALMTILVMSLALGFYGCSQDSPLDSQTQPQNNPISQNLNMDDPIPGQYIVVLKSSQFIGDIGASKVTPEKITDFASDVGVKTRHVYTTVLHGFSANLTPAQHDQLMNDPTVDYIEPDYPIHLTAVTIPWGINAVKAPVAHARGIRGAGVKIGVIDTGIDYFHPDLADNFAGGYDFVNDDSNPLDDHGHGTHVAGTIAAVDNNIGVLGAAPSVQLYGIKVLNSWGLGSIDNIIAGMDWAVNNDMDVINMSLGGGGNHAFQTACENTFLAGVVIVASAGNTFGGPVVFPAAYGSVIAVSAIDTSLNIANFSGTGLEVELTAPGEDVFSTTMGGQYGLKSGTSMASPHVAGVAALIWSTSQFTTSSSVRNRLTSTATDIGALGRDDNFGFGLVNADAATLGLGTNLPPIAVANGPYTGVAGIAVSFSSAGSSDPDGTIVGYNWDFGDGGTSTNPNPLHTYFATGFFNVSLTITDDQGATGSASTFATVSNQVPTAIANGPYTGVAESAILFSSAGSNDSDGTIVSYNWLFGDGVTSNDTNPSHTYGAVGNYTVTLTVTDNIGATGSASTTASISAPSNYAPTADPNGPYISTPGSPTLFSSAGSFDPDGTIVGYSWDFGNGATSTLANPLHTYRAIGDYTVTLTVTDDLGATGSSSTSAIINNGLGGVVTIILAEYDVSRKSQLTVRATTDSREAHLSVVGYGLMTLKASKGFWELKAKTPSMPAAVTVVSDLGGSATANVVFVTSTALFR